MFDKVKGAKPVDDDKWQRACSAKPVDADKEKMSVLLAKLESIRATSFVDSTAKTGLDSPALTVYAKFDDGKKEERVTFGKSGRRRLRQPRRRAGRRGRQLDGIRRNHQEAG